MAEKKIFTTLNTLILVFYLLSNFQCPTNNDIALPPHLLLVALPFIILCIPDAYFWLVVVWKIIDRQPPNAKAPPNLYFYRCSI